MTRRLFNRLSHLFKEKSNIDSTTSKEAEKPKPERPKSENLEITNKENRISLKREKSLSRRASLWLDSKLPKTAGKRKRKSQQQDEESIITPLRVWTQQEVPELSEKVEIPSSVIPLSYSSFSISQPPPLSSSSSSNFSNNLFLSSYIISSDQETLATVRTSIDRQDKRAGGTCLHQFEFEPRTNKLDLAKNVRSMLGDAISLADKELENE